MSKSAKRFDRTVKKARKLQKKLTAALAKADAMKVPDLTRVDAKK